MNKWIEQYKQYHAELNTNYPGNNLKPQLQHIKDLVQDTKAKTLLDFGCGKGLQYTKYKHHEEWGVMPALYDPGVPEYDTLPEGKFDGVYSTDVMEHIPKEHLPEVFNNIYSYALILYMALHAEQQLVYNIVLPLLEYIIIMYIYIYIYI
jgi:hypothetical protein